MRIHYCNVAIADANSSAIIGGIIVAEASATNSSAVLIRKRCHEYEHRRLNEATTILAQMFLFPFFPLFSHFCPSNDRTISTTLLDLIGFRLNLD